MRAVIQRVNQAKLDIDNEIYSTIGKGLVLFLAVSDDDTQEDLDWLVKKIVAMRIFSNAKGKFDKSLKELESEGMIIRKVISDRPIAVSYELTEFGSTALGILEELRVWSEDHNIQLK